MSALSALANPPIAPRAWLGASRSHVLHDEEADPRMTAEQKRHLAAVLTISGPRWARVVANGYRMAQIRDEARAGAVRLWG